MCRDTDSLSHRSYGPIRVFLDCGSWQWEGLFGWSFFVAQPIQAHKWPPCLRPFSLFCATGAEKASLSGIFIVQLLVLVCGEREATVMSLSPMHDSAVSPCFHGIQVPPKAFPTTISSLTRPCPGIVLQFICSSSQQVCFPGDLHPCQGYEWQQQGLSVWFLFHLEYHRLASSLTDSNVSPLSQTVAPMWGSEACFSSLTHQGQVQYCWLSSFSPYSPHPTEFCVILYIYFQLSGTPAWS